jgi:hypothetical protein
MPGRIWEEENGRAGSAGKEVSIGRHVDKLSHSLE